MAKSTTKKLKWPMLYDEPTYRIFELSGYVAVSIKRPSLKRKDTSRRKTDKK